MGTNVLMAICVGLKLSLRLTEKLFDKSQNKLNYFKVIIYVSYYKNKCVIQFILFISDLEFQYMKI